MSKVAGVDIAAGRMQQQSLALLTKQDIARQARVCPRTVDYWVSRGSLPVIKLGAAVRFLPADFEKFIEAHRVK
jgi:Helix-turn-helix domain